MISTILSLFDVFIQKQKVWYFFVNERHKKRGRHESLTPAS